MKLLRDLIEGVDRSAVGKSSGARKAREDAEFDRATTDKAKFDLIYGRYRAGAAGTLRLVVQQRSLILAYRKSRQDSNYVISYDTTTGDLRFGDRPVGGTATRHLTVYRTNTHDLKFSRRERPSLHEPFGYIFQAGGVDVDKQVNQTFVSASPGRGSGPRDVPARRKVREDLALLRSLLEASSAWDDQEEQTPETKAAKALAAVKEKTHVGETSKFEIYQPTNQDEIDELTTLAAQDYKFREGEYVFVSKKDPKRAHRFQTSQAAQDTVEFLRDQEVVDFLAQKEPKPLFRCMIYYDLIKLPRDRARALELAGIKESPTATYELIKALSKIDHTSDLITYLTMSVVTKILAASEKRRQVELKELTKVIDVKELNRYLEKETQLKLQLAIQKAARSPADRKHDREHDTFIFVGKDKFVDDGHGRYMKKLDIENLYKVDQDNLADQQAAPMMRMRAEIHGARLYAVTLPKGMFKEKATMPSKIPDHLLTLIDQHKRKI